MNDRPSSQQGADHAPKHESSTRAGWQISRSASRTDFTQQYAREALAHYADLTSSKGTR